MSELSERMSVDRYVEQIAAIEAEHRRKMTEEQERQWRELSALCNLPARCSICGQQGIEEPHYCYRIEETGKYLLRFDGRQRPFYRLRVFKNGLEEHRARMGSLLSHEQGEEAATDAIARLRAYDELVERGHQDAADLVWTR